MAARTDPPRSHHFSARLFRRLVREPEAEGPKTAADRRAEFGASLASTSRFFERMPSLPVQGCSILDYGCGDGATPIWLARHGAARALGIDIQSVEHAERRLERDFPELRDRVGYRRLPVATDELEGQFDLVVSKNTFEHVHDPDEYVAAMTACVKPGGRVAIGFGPLWKSPWGGHIDFMTRLPWAHLLVEEEVILRERRRFRPDEDPERFEDVRGGLNRMTLSRFLATMDGSGLRREHLATNRAEGTGSRARRAFIAGMRAASTIRPLREYCTMNVYGVWSRPG